MHTRTLTYLMPISVRRRLSCFYCGSWSAQQHRAGLRRWKCEKCEATNWLDEKGQVADPPAHTTPQSTSNLRFARSVSPPQTEHAASPHDQIVFCETCIQNQHIVRQLLSDYIPSETHPDHQKYVANFENYKADIEQRYQQCCPICAVRAREQIQTSMKMAGSDHLRRLMSRTRAMALEESDGVMWKDMVLALARLAWWSSLLFALIWHGFAAVLTAHDTNASDGKFASRQSALYRFIDCGRIAYEERWLSPPCVPDLSMLIWGNLALSFASCWWHPYLWMLLHRQNRPKIIGLSSYYTLQALGFGIRLAGLKLSIPYRESSSNLNQDFTRGLHAVVFMSLAMFTWLSRIAINFHIESSEILPKIPIPDQSQYPLSSRKPAPLFSPLAVKQAGTTAFNINNLSSNQTFQQNTDRPPTPSAEDDRIVMDGDAMDWSPSNRTSLTTLHPSRVLETRQPSTLEPSPFHGTLPPAPLAPAHKARNPHAYNPTVFRAPTEYQRASVFANMLDTRNNTARNSVDTNNTTRRRQRQRWDDDISETTSIAETEYTEIASPFPQLQQRVTRSSTAQQRTEDEVEMRQPRFWPKQDSAETGLEDLISGRSFGLSDSPVLDRNSEINDGAWGWGWSRRR